MRHWVLTYPFTGAFVNYSPDALGRPSQVSGFASSVTYWPSGQINSITYANGTSNTYGQNNRLWPSSFAVARGGATIVSTSYGYDGVGNLKSINDTFDSYYNRVLDYDNINRLTTANGPWGGGTISYSGAGNITSQSLGSWGLSYGYDGQNRLSNLSGSRNCRLDSAR